MNFNELVAEVSAREEAAQVDVIGVSNQEAVKLAGWFAISTGITPEECTSFIRLALVVRMIINTRFLTGDYPLPVTPDSMQLVGRVIGMMDMLCELKPLQNHASRAVFDPLLGALHDCADLLGVEV